MRSCSKAATCVRWLAEIHAGHLIKLQHRVLSASKGKRTFSLNSSSLFRPHPNLSDEVNRNIVQSEIEGGVRLEDLQPGSKLEVTTHNTRYQLLILIGNVSLIMGHPLYCPHPVLVRINGSTWGGSMLKVRFIGRGMCMEFVHPQYQTAIITSPIREIREFLQPRESKMAAVA